MNIKIRRIILSFFLLFFFITAPIIILFASGYRFDIKKLELIRTGSLFIETPTIKNTDIYINGVIYPEKLNKKIFIKNLLPNKYNISLIKEGRYLWEKEIEVNPSITTFIKDALLFLIAQPTLEMQIDNVITSNLSPNKEQVAIVIQNNKNQEVHLFDIKEKTIKKIYIEENQSIPNISWSQNSKNLLIVFENNTIIYKQNNELLNFVNSKNKHTNVKWNNTHNNIIFIYNNQFDQFEIDTKITKTINESKNLIQDVIGDSSNYFYIENTEQESLLKQHNANFESTILIAKLPRSQEYQFIDLNNEQILLKNASSNKILLVKRPKELNFLDLKDDVIQFDSNYAVFDQSKNNILLYNDFELKNYNLSEKKLVLIDRYSKQIRSAIWYNDNNHILVEFKDSIIITDLNSNSKTSKIELTNNINNLKSLNLINSKYLFFTGKINEIEGIYFLQID